MKSLKAEIVSVGTELLLGQIANTNARWLSEQLALHGINTYYHTVVGDNLKRLKDLFHVAERRSDVIVITGGLGPTEDDLTREAFQAMTNIKIVEHTPSLQKIKSFYKQQNRQMTDNNRRQARVFEKSTVLENKTGMAPGIIVEHEGKKWIFLPGVPREMKQIATDNVLPYLKQINGQTLIKSTVLRFIGIGESLLEEKLKQILNDQSNPTIALLSSRDGMTIRLTAKAESEQEADQLLQEMKDTILNEVGDYYYGTDDVSIENVIVNRLKKANLRVASAESLTGGQFANKIISSPGASQVCRGSIVCYDKRVKQDVLNVSEETINTYGTVSEQCAKEMAKNVAEQLDANIGISFTGVAGPNKTENKDVGTVYIGIYTKDGYERVEKFHFQGTRQMIRQTTTLKGLEILFNYLK